MRKGFHTLQLLTVFTFTVIHSYSRLFSASPILPSLLPWRNFPPPAKIDARVFSQVPTFLLSIPDPASFLPKVHCSPGEGRSLKDERLPSPPPFPRSLSLLWRRNEGGDKLTCSFRSAKRGIRRRIRISTKQKAFY